MVLCGMALLLATVVLNESWLTLASAALMAAPVLGSVFVMLPRSPMRYEAHLTPVKAFAPGPLSLSLTSTARRKWAPSRFVRVFVDGVQTSPTRVRSSGPLSTTKFRVSPAQRGLHKAGPVIEYFMDPFGCAYKSRVVPLNVKTLVWPEVTSVTIPFDSRAIDSSSSASHNRSGDDDLDRLRPYVPGDDPRTVHWRSSARRGDLLVRLNVNPPHLHPVVVLDDTSTSFEITVSAAASLFVSLHEDRMEPHLCFVSSLINNNLDYLAQYEDALDALAHVTPAQVSRDSALPSLKAMSDDAVFLVTDAALRVPDPPRGWSLVRVGPGTNVHTLHDLQKAF